MNDYRNRKYCCQNNDFNMNINCDNNMNDICDNNMNNMIEQNEECSNICTQPINNCDCGFDMGTESVFPDNPMFGQSYVPIQRMNKVFTPEVGLKMGTIFPELVSSYTPCQSIREIEFIRNNNEIGEGCNR